MSLKWTTIVVDENIPREVVDHLRSLGFKSVVWINDFRRGQTDPEVWRYAAGKEAILVTGDRGFAPQLSEQELLDGPSVVCFSTKGLQNNELQDPEVMRFLLGWLFEKGHYSISEWHSLQVHGDARTKKQVAQRTRTAKA